MNLLAQGAVGYYEDLPSEAMLQDSLWIGTEIQRVIQAVSGTG